MLSLLIWKNNTMYVLSYVLTKYEIFQIFKNKNMNKRMDK